ATKHPDHAADEGLHDSAVRSAQSAIAQQHHAWRDVAGVTTREEGRPCYVHHHHERHGRAQTDHWLHGASYHHHDGDEVIAGRVLAKQYEDGDRWLVHRRHVRARLRQQPRVHELSTKSERRLSGSL